jgi:hypothetical protein
MKASHRILVTGALLLVLVVAFWGLSYVGTRTEGPLGRLLSATGVVVSEVENWFTRALRGKGREAQLEWFSAYRNDLSRLQQPDRILLGAYDNGLPHSMETVLRLEQALGTTFPLVHFYTAWGDKPEQQFPQKLVTTIWNLGSVPVITWEPWLVDFENTKHPHLPLREQRDKDGLEAIARGEYDFYIDQWAKDAAAFGKAIFVRPFHEMNDPYRYPWGPQNNSAADFIAAWRHVANRFRVAGATNVIWVWSPHLAYEFYTYYPGDAYVDWVATLALNYGTVANWSKWWTFEEIVGTKYVYLEALNKPIMLAEVGSLAVGGDREEWYRAALTNLPERYPAVKALLFFHNSSDATVTYQRLDWSFVNDSTMVAVVREAIRPLQESIRDF